jgi:hypothetical protein
MCVICCSIPCNEGIGDNIKAIARAAAIHKRLAKQAAATWGIHALGLRKEMLRHGYHAERQTNAYTRHSG